MGNRIIIRGGTWDEWVASLRGVAALLVFISHLPLDMSYGMRFVIGRIGVTAFFLISGYLSVTSRRKMSRRRYLFNRFIRIYPIYWFLLFAMCLVMEKSNLSLARIVANITCFQEFLGQSNIIDSSWMLPIQIIYFVIIAFVGVERLIEIKGRSVLVISVCGILSIIVGLLRSVTGKPFPTAFFLLINVAFIGALYKEYQINQNRKKQLRSSIVLFEITLFIAVYFSYKDKFLHYVCAYNMGLFIFWVIDKINININIFKRLGKIGFAFFLGAEIPYVLLERFVDFSSSVQMRICGSISKFVLAIGFAFVVTKFIQKPLQKRLKRVEQVL